MTKTSPSNHVWVLADDRLDRLAHRAEVNGHVRGVGDEVTIGIEHGAAEVEALLDVDRGRSVLQDQPHLFGDVHEQVVEDFKLNRINVGANGRLDQEGRPLAQESSHRVR